MSSASLSSSAVPDHRKHGVRALLHGMWMALPLGIGVLPFGFAVGALAVQQGLSPWQAVIMSLLVNAGTAQFLALELWLQAGPGAILLGTLFVNSRLVLLGLAFRAFATLRKRRHALLLAFAVTDPSWAMAAGARHVAEPKLVMAGSSLLLFLVWVPSTGAGAWLGTSIAHPERWGLDFLFVAALLVILRGQWRGVAHVLPWLVSAGAALLVQRLLGTGPAVLLGALAGTFSAALLPKAGVPLGRKRGPA